MPHCWKAQRSSWRKWNGGAEDWGGFGCTKTETWVGVEIELLVEKKENNVFGGYVLVRIQFRKQKPLQVFVNREFNIKNY